eukprot:CAMPEP_0195007568 /NCGR_PEP_ID=MMETSP0326_2-20130528/7738_1 /TAXON_ID=2866 ORGANISM="Crypthecodinium cohnii, Strain Seligo" /NCGR_SAMPLE_ID=MMETSP0326_2 /ASSEMBLY_ACC=CAM_ASM_000348 /LENGTH=60 /DNA_ID=CAMNT_0040014995 /DNA_START=89 /DNA_END=267 /DNA_ORIENTATION=+
MTEGDLRQRKVITGASCKVAKESAAGSWLAAAASQTQPEKGATRPNRGRGDWIIKLVAQG